MRGTLVHRFGPFELEPASRQLFREQKRVRLSSPQSAILTHLVSHVGLVVSKETLIDAAWGGIPISENSLDQAVSRLRKVLGQGRRQATYIETLPKQGYRFIAPVEQAERDGEHAHLEAQLAPYRAFVQGRTELDTLDRDAIQRARQGIEDALRKAPAYAPAHVDLAMACGLAFEATTPDATQDTAALERGIRHARTACSLAPASGEAWSTLAFVLYLTGDTDEAAAAAYKAVFLEPQDWRHALRQAYVSWGDKRIEAAGRVLRLCPGMALAHWLRATVFIARGAFEHALDVLRIGCEAQDTQSQGTGFPAVGLHLLHGLVLAARGRLDAAAGELVHELSWADSGQLYARECAANTWYALGAVRLRQGKRADADAAFTRALTIAPRHASATAALRGKVPTSKGPAGPPEGGHYVRAMDTATGQAIVLARGGRHADAARVYREALEQMPPYSSAGWLLPVEPLLNPLAHRETWDHALTIVSNRAT